MQLISIAVLERLLSIIQFVSAWLFANPGTAALAVAGVFYASLCLLIIAMFARGEGLERADQEN